MWKRVTGERAKEYSKKIWKANKTNQRNRGKYTEAREGRERERDEKSKKLHLLQKKKRKKKLETKANVCLIIFFCHSVQPILWTPPSSSAAVLFLMILLWFSCLLSLFPLFFWQCTLNINKDCSLTLILFAAIRFATAEMLKNSLIFENDLATERLLTVAGWLCCSSSSS